MATAPTIAPLTPFSPQDSLQTILVGDLYPEHDTSQTITRESALRIPAVKRSHDIHCSVLSKMPWRQYDGDAEIETQPSWLVTSRSGISPRTLRWGVASDLFMSAWAAIGFEMESEGHPVDALHIPFGWWSVRPDGTVDVDERVPAQYRELVVPIPLGYGSNGMLTDARDTMRAARAIEAAYRDRVENPIAQTVLTLNEDRWDMWEQEEREEFRDLWVKNRAASGGATAMKPSWVSVDYAGQIATDLFESARNGARLDIANHAAIPASLLEGSRQGGGTDIKYSGVSDGATRNELWDYGLAKYADSIDGRLSLDDVCPPGQSIRVDASAYLAVPQPTTPLTSED